MELKWVISACLVKICLPNVNLGALYFDVDKIGFTCRLIIVRCYASYLFSWMVGTLWVVGFINGGISKRCIKGTFAKE